MPTNIKYTDRYLLSSARTKERSAIDWEAVGGRLRELRGFAVNQADLAKRIGISQGFYSRAERGQQEIGAGILLKISEHFGVSLHWLLTGKEFEPKK